MINRKHKHCTEPFMVFLAIIILTLGLNACGSGDRGGDTKSNSTNQEAAGIGPDGGTITSSDGKAWIVIPAGVLTGTANVTVTTVSNQPSGNIGTAFEIGPDGTIFSRPVTIYVTYDEASIPAGVQESDLKLGTVINNKWEALSNSTVDLTANVISGSTTHLSLYGLLAVNSSVTAPSSPAGLTAIAADRQATIAWDPVTGAVSYNIYMASQGGVTKINYSTLSNGMLHSDVTSPYVHTGLTNGTTYYFTVTAVNPDGESIESSEVSTTPAISVIIPKAPDNLRTNAVSNTRINLTWTDNSANEDGFKIERKTGANGTYSQIATVVKDIYNYSDTAGLTADTAYCYQVRAFNSAGDSGYTHEICTRSFSAAAVPSAPTGITATAGDEQVTISWDVVSGATSYNIYWSEITGVTKSTGTKDSGGTSPYLHTGRINGTTYYYIVTAVNSIGESSESDQVYATPQAAPISKISLPKTGQLYCYDSSGDEKACTGTGQDGELQKGVEWPIPRFTDNGDGTITDKLTGLIWTKDADAPGPSICSPGIKKIWQSALDYVACLNRNGYLGYNDWHLPNINEIGSVLHAGNTSTTAWLTSQGFTNTQSDFYWSSTSYADNPSNAWIIHMLYSSKSSNDKFDNSYYVWPVRSGQSGLFNTSIIQLPKTGQTACYDSSGSEFACKGTGQDGELQKGVEWPTPRFTGNGDGTITDKLTGLIWTKDANAPGPPICSPGVNKTWQTALDYVACLNTNSYLGYTDWHLPNINEFGSLVNAGEDDSSIWLKSQGIDNVQSISYWSSTSYANDLSRAWAVTIWSGGVGYGPKSHNCYVWPVRSGQ